MNVDDMAGQSVRLKEEHLRKEEEKVNYFKYLSLCIFHTNFYLQLREIELKVQREIQEKRAELMNKEEALRSLEARLSQAQLTDA